MCSLKSEDCFDPYIYSVTSHSYNGMYVRMYVLSVTVDDIMQPSIQILF